jgi:hypothetical protein
MVLEDALQLPIAPVGIVQRETGKLPVHHVERVLFRTFVFGFYRSLFTPLVVAILHPQSYILLSNVFDQILLPFFRRGRDMTRWDRLRAPYPSAADRLKSSALVLMEVRATHSDQNDNEEGRCARNYPSLSLATENPSPEEK